MRDRPKKPLRRIVGGSLLSAILLYSSASMAQTQYGAGATAGPWATAIGESADATGTGSVAVGSSASAIEFRDIAIGDNATANGVGSGHSIAIGAYADTSAQYGTALGYESLASATGATAAGSGATASGADAAAYGSGSLASGAGSAAVGQWSGASGAQSAAFGYDSKAQGTQSASFGASSVAAADNSVALGASSYAGRGAQTNYSAAYMAEPQTSVGEVSVGNAGAERQITNVAAGSAPTDAVNVAQLTSAITPLEDDIADLAGQIGSLTSSVRDAKNIAKSAGAIGMAASQIRYDDRPGRLSLGVGGGAYEGHGAVAAGLGYTSPDQLWRANVAGSVATGSRAAVGAGLSLTLN